MIIEAFQEASSSPDYAWKIISNIDAEHEYWAAIHSVRKRWLDSATMERRVYVLKGLCSFTEMVTLHPGSIHVHIADGPFTGTKAIEVIPVGPFKTKLHIRWDIGLSIFLRTFSHIISWYIARQSKKALAKMETCIAMPDFDLDGELVS